MANRQTSAGEFSVPEGRRMVAGGETTGYAKRKMSRSSARPGRDAGSVEGPSRIADPTILSRVPSGRTLERGVA